ncbi:MAG: hypothetical protein J6N18_13165 [Kiritimatiellae bacterium]|nr:hypothetical protein [Kiritimatiellia bacterium]MBR3822949.1 hypothetical protein [Kiritimatiellia bacterium]
MKKALYLFIIACVLLAGCATWTFAPIRSARFVSEEGVYLNVDYGREEHESTFVAPNGLELPFRTKLKVRVTAPDGRRFVAWQVMSPRGVLYMTDDKHWEYFEEGTGCVLAERSDDGDGYELRFQGVLCANLKPVEESRRSRR